MVAEMGVWVGEEWRWNIEWRRNFFEWEIPLANNLMQEINRIQLKQGIKDSWCWIAYPDCGFTVKEAYKTQINLEASQDKELCL